MKKTKGIKFETLCYTGGFKASGADRGLERDRGGHRPDGLLHIRGVGHHSRACSAQRKVLLVLRGAVPGHHVFLNVATQNALLHGEPDNPLRGHLVPLGAGVLPAERQWRKGIALHLDSALADCVLFAAGGDHPSDVANSAAARQVPAVHDGPGDVFGGGNNRGAECELPVAGDPPDGALGSRRLHPDTAKVFDAGEAAKKRLGRRAGGGR